jgi:ketosteroid isomerase-like protein
MACSEPDVDRLAIMKTTGELLAAVNASDVDHCIAVWADEGVMMPPHHPAVQGRAALRQFFASLFSEAKFRFTFTSSQIDVVGDIALEYVTYSALMWSSLSGGSPADDVGKGLHVYKRQPDGSWKLTRDIWNTDRPIGENAG